MKRKILIILFLISPFIVFALTPPQERESVLNPYTGNFDYLNKLSSTSVGRLLDVSTINATVGNYLQFNGSQFVPISISTILAAGSTNYIQNRSSLQAGSTFYTSSGTADTLYQSGYQVLDISGSTQTKTGGLNVMGNVGIGTSNPLAKFSINGGSFAVLNTGLVGVGTYLPTQPFESRSSLATGFFHRRTAATASNGGGFISVGVDDGAATSSGDRLGGITFFGAEDTVGTVHNPVSIEGFASEGWNSSTGGGHLTFNTNDNGLPSRGEKMRLTHNGNLGIGTTSPSAALHVSSSAYFATGTGNVGVGTSVSSSKLHIVPDLGYSSGWLRGIVSTGANVIENGNVAIGLHTDKSMYFMTKGLADYTTTSWGNSVAMKVQGDGNVGIGSIYPETNLHISGSIPVLTLQGANEFLGPQFRFRGSAGTLSSPSIPTQPDFYAGSLYWDAYNGSAWKGVGAFLVNGDGTPSATSLPTSFNFLTTSPNQVDAGVKAQLNSTGDFFVNSINSADTNRLGVGTFSMATGAQFEVSKSTFVVQTAGNVGIGTNAPTQRLHIADQTTSGAVATLQSFRSSSGSNSQVVFNKARGTIASPSSVTNGDSLGQYAFNGYDGSAYIPSAAIVASVDGVTGANDMPGRIGFRTTPDGASATLERMAINNGGYVGIGTSDPQARLNVFESQNSVLGTLLSSNFGHYIRMIPGTCDGCYNGLVKQGDNVIIYSSGTPNTGSLTIAQWRSDSTLNGMRIDTNGNIGIGTTNPGSIVDIRGSGGQYSNQAKDLTFGNKTYTESIIRSTETTASFGGSYRADLAFLTNNNNTVSEKMRIQYDGNVGIGTTGPTAPLHIYGTANRLVKIQNTGDYARMVLNGSNGNGTDIIMQANGVSQWGLANLNGRLAFLGSDSTSNEYMSLTTAGSVGIGTTNPGAKLHVYGSGNEKIALTNSSLTSPDRSSLGIDSSEGFQILTGRTNSNHNNFTLRTGDFDNSSSARLTVLGASGNVGIGTTNPGAKLTVKGGAFSQADFADGDKFFLLGNASAAKITHNSGWLFSSYAGATSAGGGGSNTGAFNWYTVNGSDTHVERMMLTNAGNVGIGTNNPAYKLELSADSAGKPTTNTWTITSDSRTKEAIQDYSVGLDRIRQIRPITFTHNGKGGTPKGASGIGILAQEIKTIFPGTVIEQERVFESTDDVKGFDYEKVVISSAVTRDIWSVQNGPEDILTGTTYYQLNGGGNALVFKNNNFYFLFPIGKTGRYNEVKNNASIFLFDDDQGHSMILQKQVIEVTPEKPGYKTKVLSFNSHELTFALINAVKELLNKIDNLDNRLRILEER